MFIKKNQIIVFVLALLLITAGYLGVGQQTQTNEVIPIASNVDKTKEKDENENLGDATLVNGGVLVPNEISTENISAISTENTINTNSNINTTDDYFTNSKLERETMYSQTIASYQKIIDSSEITSEQKSIAQNEIIKLNNEKNAIMIIENLIKTKGFSDVVIFINNSSVNVIVKANTLSKESVAQIQNIVSRELNTEINNIHISIKEQ